MIRANRRSVYEVGVPVAQIEVTRKEKEMLLESLKGMEASKYLDPDYKVILKRS